MLRAIVPGRYAFVFAVFLAGAFLVAAFFAAAFFAAGFFDFFDASVAPPPEACLLSARMSRDFFRDAVLR